MINCHQKPPGMRPIFTWGNHFGKVYVSSAKTKQTNKKDIFPPSSETNASLHSLKTPPCCQDFAVALAGTSDALSCYLWTRLCSCDYSCKIGMWDFLFLFWFPIPQLKCLQLGRNSPVLPGFPHYTMLFCPSGHCKACSCGWDLFGQSVQWTKEFRWLVHLQL